MTDWFENKLERGLFTTWAVLVFVLLVLFLSQVRGGLNLKTNILELMPAAEQDPVFETSRSAFEGTMGKTVLILLENSSASGASTGDQLTEARRRVKTLLDQSDVFGTVRGFDQSGGRPFYDLYFPHRYHLLAPSVRQILRSEQPISSLKQHIQRGLHRQTMPLSSDLLERDPLLFFPELLNHWSDVNASDQAERAENENTDGQQEVLIGRLNQDPLSPEVQRTVDQLIDRCKSVAQQQEAGVTLRWTGLVRLAMVSRNRMQNDASWIGTISLLGVILLVYLVFRSFRHLLLLVSTVLIGLMSAFTITQMVFDLHVVTIAFGATLIGISVDYAFHYYTNHRYRTGWWSPWNGLKQIFPGITFGLLTSLMAFSSLSFTPLPALQQIAIFTCIGLLGAYLTVVSCFPFMARVLLPSDRTPDKISGPDLPGALARKLVGLWRTVGSGTASVVVLSSSMILIVVLLVFGLSSLQFNDNLEQLAQIPDELKENDRYIRNATGIKNTGRYILVEAASKEQLLQRQEEIRQQLDELKSANAFDGYWGLLPFLPSQRRQKQNLKLIEGSLLSQSEQLRTALRDVGYRSDINDELVSTLKTTVRNEQVLTVDEWLNHPASFGLRQLWLGCSDGRCSSLIILKQIRNEQRIEQTFESLDFAHYRNRKRAFERVMRQYRVRSITLASAAYGIILLFLLLRYGLRMGLLMFLPSVLGTFITISSLSLFGVEFHLMHVLAVLIILGMGIDYTIFLVEEAQQDQSIQPTMVALILSALTTVLSFGCLAFSQAAVIHSIGLIVFPGILLILLLSPMVCMMFPDEH